MLRAELNTVKSELNLANLDRHKVRLMYHSLTIGIIDSVCFSGPVSCRVLSGVSAQEIIEPGPEVIKFFTYLTQHEIYPAHKC